MFLTSSKISKDGLKCFTRIFLAVLQTTVLHPLFFNLKRGVRQGCLLSGLLFVLGIELLNLAIQMNSNIKGIKVGEEEIKNTLYANDTTLLLRDLDSV